MRDVAGKGTYAAADVVFLWKIHGGRTSVGHGLFSIKVSHQARYRGPKIHLGRAGWQAGRHGRLSIKEYGYATLVSFIHQLAPFPSFCFLLPPFSCWRSAWSRSGHAAESVLLCFSAPEVHTLLRPPLSFFRFVFLNWQLISWNLMTAGRRSFPSHSPVSLLLFFVLLVGHGMRCSS